MPGTTILGSSTALAKASEVVVVKLGGRSLDAPGALLELVAELTAVPGTCVIVHGGGSEVTGWCERLDIAARFDDGLRVTDGPTLEVATAVLAGLANKRLVAALRGAGVDAMGIAALDGGIVTVRPHAAGERLGHVGEVAGVDGPRLARWLASGIVPVIASIGAHEGQLLNLNADDVAAALAAALGARALVLLSDTPGVRVGGVIATTLDLAALDRALEGDDITGGMRPKLRAARCAVTAGVGRAHVTAWAGAGTLAALLVFDRQPPVAGVPSRGEGVARV